MLKKLKRFLKRNAVRNARKKENRIWIRKAEGVMARNEDTFTLEEVMNGR